MKNKLLPASPYCIENENKTDDTAADDDESHNAAAVAIRNDIDDTNTSLDDRKISDIEQRGSLIDIKTSDIDGIKSSIIEHNQESINIDLPTSNDDNNVTLNKDNETSDIDDRKISNIDDKAPVENKASVDDIKASDIDKEHETRAIDDTKKSPIDEHRPTDVDDNNTTHIDAIVESQDDVVDDVQPLTIAVDCDNIKSASMSDNECSNHSRTHEDDYDDDETNVSQPTTALSDRSFDLDDDNSFDRFTKLPNKHHSFSNCCDDGNSADPLDENTKSSDMIVYRQTSIRHRRQSIWMKDYDTSTATLSKTLVLRKNNASSSSSESRKNVRLSCCRQATRSAEPNRFKPLSNEAYLNRLPSDVSDFSNDSNDDHSYHGGNLRRFHAHRRIATRRQAPTRHAGNVMVPCRVLLRRLSMSLIAKTDAKLKMEPKILLERCDDAIIDATSSPIGRRREIGQQYYGDRIIVDESSDENEPLVKLQTKKRKSIDVEWKPTSCPKSKKVCYLSDENLVGDDENETQESGW